MTGRQFLYIIIATFITIVAWVVFDIAHSSNKSQVAPDVQQLLEPINPNFDLEAVELLP